MEQIDLNRIPLYARRDAVARHDVSPHVLDILARDPDPDVRHAVAGHPFTPLESLQTLTKDAVSRVANRARIMAMARQEARTAAS